MAPNPEFRFTSLNHNSPTTVPPVGLYQVHVSQAYCHVYRNGKLVTSARSASNQHAVAQARRNVRLARKCGGL